MGWERVSGVERSDHRRMRREGERKREKRELWFLFVCLSVRPLLYSMWRLLLDLACALSAGTRKREMEQ